MPHLDDIRHARIYLSRAARHPAPHLHRLIEDLGPVAAAELVSVGDVPAAVAVELHDNHRAIRVRDNDFGDPRHEIRVVVPEDTDLWPAEQFRAQNVPDDDQPWLAPLALWTRGSTPLPELWARSVTITGSKAATGYGCHIATELGQHLADRRITTTTGASYGVEGYAARGALSRGGPTVAVLPCGIDLAHPNGHLALLERIAADGALVSAYPPGTQPHHGRFLDRTGLLAAAGHVLVVVEAGLRSGSLAAARHANRLRRTVLAVPGPITSVSSAGSNALLRDMAAVAVTAISEVGDSLEDTLSALDTKRGTPC